ncbi:MAG: hypothetical protein ACM3L8_02520 [Verrucomicrobiota bacterium]
MFLLRREYHDGAEVPEIVFLHATVTPHGAGAGPPYRASLVAAPTGEPGRRAAFLRVPEIPDDGTSAVRYRFCAVRAGEEWRSPWFEVTVPGDELLSDLYRLPEEGAGNLPPAPGRGFFRLVLPLAEGEDARGLLRFGFGAMRKKPSPLLCRVAVDAGDGPAPVVEIPETLSVLKNRPMPYFLYHVRDDGSLHSAKIACARITLSDPEGGIACARMVWGDPAWRAPNVSPMEAKGFPAQGGAAGEDGFAEDHEAFLEGRFSALSGLPVPHVFEAYVFGPSGSRVEYCFQTVVRRPAGGHQVRWRNRDGGGNWVVTL